MIAPLYQKVIRWFAVKSVLFVENNGMPNKALLRTIEGQMWLILPFYLV